MRNGRGSLSFYLGLLGGLLYVFMLTAGLILVISWAVPRGWTTWVWAIPLATVFFGGVGFPWPSVCLAVHEGYSGWPN